MFLMIDNYDSFVYNLVRYFEELGEKVLVYRNDKITLADIKRIKPEGIIISPGPKSPEYAGKCMEIVEKFKGQIPILGICLGHQVIAEVFGGKIVPGREPVHGKVSVIKHSGKYIFKDIKNPMKVTRYHSLIVERDSLPVVLEITSETDDGVIMGIRHKNYFIEGLQFHPEAELTQYGHEILENFINEVRSQNKLVKG
ncbi:anthranilate synthase component II [Clostridium estertheticum]|uniref:Anthranilate synthase component II n=2 Tax=Clostridium estertheticum TaxID=238834 RepID=A0A1J0GJA0_9CLOT|nr:aminodeoxychorismate/anthranilate synthase component II [Clostridium estertheticum]APC41409.1 anthranilate synthase component II [Clostridium estertheticum subsp. estertheticum]MBU3072910.1 aminodeoxychorismate/anthranilate synthase component II [Clostridium estertheticum]MBU3163053.1 aminodeoxychorismate/anthranilate synthase component II [Clostridium estertheticum]MBU3174601.1 aminodeoxychorismate/anthranilate synthase component II [Clostridium estertheticum]MBU3183788.1 aminodeoxychorism